MRNIHKFGKNYLDYKHFLIKIKKGFFKKYVFKKLY